MASRVTYQADFTANTGSAEANVKQYAASIKAANTALAQAERTARESYQSQSLQAKAAGASTEQLSRIQQKYAQDMLAVRNAAQQLGQQLVQSNQQVISSEEAKAQAIMMVKDQLVQETAAVEALAAANAHQSHEAISGVQATSAAIRGLEGSGGIRAVENFISKTLGLGPAMQAIFPLVGGAMFAKMLFDIGEKVYEVGHQAAQAATLTRAAFEDQHATAQVTIDDLNVQADKLQDNISKLEGHPGNGLKTALDEARQYADKLQVSLAADRKELEALLKEHAVGAFGSLLSGVAATGKQDKEILNDHKAVQAQIASANAQFNTDSANAKSLDDIRKAGEKRDAAVRTAIQGTIDTYKREAKRLRDEQAASEKQAAAAIDYAASQGHNTSGIKALDNSAKIANIEGTSGKYQDFLNQFNATGNVASLTEKENKLKGDKENDKLAGEAARKALEAQKQAAADQRKQWDDDHAAWAAAMERSAEDEAAFWVDRANETVRGSENYAEASKKADEALKKSNEERRKRFDESLKMAEEFASIAQKNVLSATLPGFAANAKGVANAYTSGKALEDSQRAGAFAVAQANIALAAQQGQISRNDAAVQLATLNQIEYEQKLADLKEKLASVQAGPEADAQTNAINKQIAELSSGRVLQQMQDSAQVASATIAGALKNVNAQWLADSKDTAKQIADVYRGTVDGLNHDLSTALMDIGTRGHRHVGRELGNAVGSTFRSAGSGLASYGLKSAESSILGKFGFAGKPDGSKGNPLHVIMDSMGSKPTAGGNVFQGVTNPDGSNSLVKSLMSFIPGGGLISGLFGGGRAVGGGINAGTTYLVGEKGPELITPQSSSYVHTAAATRSMFGGQTIHFSPNIDARGASDPAAVRAQVQQGIMEAAPHIVAAASATQRDQRSRTTSSSRW